VIHGPLSPRCLDRIGDAPDQQGKVRTPSGFVATGKIGERAFLAAIRRLAEEKAWTDDRGPARRSWFPPFRRGADLSADQIWH
jgi:hypothetical protein